MVIALLHGRLLLKMKTKPNNIASPRYGRARAFKLERRYRDNRSTITVYNKKYGPDRIAGFTPIPAMSMISYAAGASIHQFAWW